MIFSYIILKFIGYPKLCMKTIQWALASDKIKQPAYFEYKLG